MTDIRPTTGTGETEDVDADVVGEPRPLPPTQVEYFVREDRRRLAAELARRAAERVYHPDDAKLMLLAAACLLETLT